MRTTPPRIKIAIKTPRPPKIKSVKFPKIKGVVNPLRTIKL